MTQKERVFLIPVNETEEGSVTLMKVNVGAVSMRVAKRKLRVVFTEWNIPVNFHKKLLKELCDE